MRIDILYNRQKRLSGRGRRKKRESAERLLGKLNQKNKVEISNTEK